MRATLFTRVVGAGLALMGCLGSALAQSADGKTDGQSGLAVFKSNCAACHDPGPGHPGSARLQELERPHPALQGRSDVDADYVRAVVRNGLVEMPPFRQTEISDSELDQLARFLAGSSAPGTSGAPK